MNRRNPVVRKEIIRLFVANISRTACARDITMLFSKYASVYRCDIVKNFAFIELHCSNPDVCIANINGVRLRGCTIVVRYSNNSGGPARPCYDPIMRGLHWCCICLGEPFIRSVTFPFTPTFTPIPPQAPVNQVVSFGPGPMGPIYFAPTTTDNVPYFENSGQQLPQHFHNPIAIYNHQYMDLYGAHANAPYLVPYNPPLPTVNVVLTGFDDAPQSSAVVADHSDDASNNSDDTPDDSDEAPTSNQLQA